MRVAAILGHFGRRGRVPRVHRHLVVVVLRRAARIELQVEVPGPGEGDSLLESEVVSDGVDGLHRPPRGPGSRDTDVGELSRTAIEKPTQLRERERGGNEMPTAH